MFQEDIKSKKKTQLEGYFPWIRSYALYASLRPPNKVTRGEGEEGWKSLKFKVILEFSAFCEGENFRGVCMQIPWLFLTRIIYKRPPELFPFSAEYLPIFHVNLVALKMSGAQLKLFINL